MMKRMPRMEMLAMMRSVMAIIHCWWGVSVDAMIGDGP